MKEQRKQGRGNGPQRGNGGQRGNGPQRGNGGGQRGGRRTPFVTNITMLPGEAITLTIRRLGINGEGVGYYKKQVVFVQGALPEEEVLVEIVKVEKNFAEGMIRRIIKRSPYRTKPMCPIYDECGGCQLQHMDYRGQLKAKRDIVIQALEKHAQYSLEGLDIRQTNGMSNPWHYRNKSQFQVSVDRGQVISGLYSLNTHKLINIDNCPIQHELTNKVTNTIKDIMTKLGTPVYFERKHTGSVRTIVTRVGFETEEVQVVIVTATKELPKADAIVKEIRRRLPEVVSIMHNVNQEKTSIVFGDETHLLWGKPTIDEELGDNTFELSARAFFQLNPVQTEKLYDAVWDAARLTGKEKVVDAYCGVGTIGLWLAEGASEVRGMDIVPEAIQDAKNNAKLNEASNVKFEVGTAEDVFPRWARAGFKPDVVVVDPPRTGCDDQLLKSLLRSLPERIVYVSCNPSSLARDTNILSKAYKVSYIQPFDMFPMTAQVETVTLLERK